jgi:peptidoglycan/LPS O-acetylase OafA/YrhL
VQNHLPALDGIRGLAILMVLAFHLWQMGDPNVFVRSAWQRLIAGGWCGVDLFLVLSGFLITGILHDSRTSPHYFRSFYMRRVLRIFPLYYGFLALFFFVLPLLFAMGDGFSDLAQRQYWLWLYAQNFYPLRHLDGLPCGLNHLWSLAVEEQFYIVWPFLIRRLSLKGSLGMCLGVVLLAVATRTALNLSGVPPSIIYGLTICRMDGFALGALVALLVRTERGAPRAAFWALPLLVVSLALIVFLVHPYRGVLVWHSREMQTVGFTVLGISFASLVTLAVTGSRRSLAQRFFSLGSLRWLGKYSYGIYIIHYPILAATSTWQPWLVRCLGSLTGQEFAVRLLQRPIFLSLLASVFSLTGAFLSWHLYEKQFLKLKRFFPRHEDRAMLVHPWPERKAA